MSTEIVQQTKAPLAMNGRGVAVTSLEDLWRLATAVCKGGFAPRGLDTPEKAMAAMAMGSELGIPPMTSLRCIAVINGRPSVYGDMAIALVHNSSQLEYCKEWIAGDGDARTAHCEAQRVGRPEPVKRQFSVADAKRAGLWQKEGPWKLYPDRMLQMRARGYALRDEFADVLQGLYLAEESQDIIDSSPVDCRPRVESVIEKVRNALPSPQSQPPAVEPTPAPVTQAIQPVAEAAGPVEAEHQQPEPPQPWKTYDMLEEAVCDIAQSRGKGRIDAKKCLHRDLLAIGKVGKGEETTPEWRKAAYQAATDGRGRYVELTKPKDPVFDAEGPKDSII